MQTPADPAVVRLSFSTGFQNGWLHTLEADGVSDAEGNTLNDGKIIFSWYEPVPGDLVINEVLFNPYEGGEDFVELYNRSDKTADLKKIRAAGANYETGIINETEKISDTSVFLLPGDFVVLTENPEAIKKFYSIKNPAAFIAVEAMPSYNNDRGAVLLADSSGVILEKLRYSETMHHPLIYDVEGVSLERINFKRPAGDSTNWHSAAADAGFATPGYRNSQFSETPPVKGTVSLEPEVFSPDNDGYHDIVNVHYKFDEPGFTANAAVYDASGRIVRSLLNNELLGYEGTFSWNGITNNYEKAPVGLYIIFLEAFNLKGEVVQYKRVCGVSMTK
jgi:hypothetical protein